MNNFITILSPMSLRGFLLLIPAPFILRGKTIKLRSKLLSCCQSVMRIKFQVSQNLGVVINPNWKDKRPFVQCSQYSSNPFRLIVITFGGIYWYWNIAGLLCRTSPCYSRQRGHYRVHCHSETEGRVGNLKQPMQHSNTLIQVNWYPCACRFDELSALLAL